MKYEFIFIIHTSESFPRQLEKWIENVQVLEKGDPKKVHGRVTICRLTKFFSSDETLVSSCTLCTATCIFPVILKLRGVERSMQWTFSVTNPSM